MTPYAQADTDWRLSAKGNYWKRSNGVLLVVGQGSHGGCWAMRDGTLLSGSYDTLKAAKRAAEAGS